MTSTIFRTAAGLWAQMRSDYERYLESAYGHALEGTGGVLVNKEGRALRIDGLDLFTGPERRARKYASEELIEYWGKVPRLSLAEYERQWMEGRQEWPEAG